MLDYDLIVYWAPKKGKYPKVLIPVAVKRFCQSVYKLYGIKFELEIKKDDEAEMQICLADYSYPISREETWDPQFTFYIYNSKRIFLKALKLPETLQKKGIGAYCTKWLIRFCSDFGFECIYGGSYKEAEPFWEKMGFVKTKENLHFY